MGGRYVKTWLNDKELKELDRIIQKKRYTTYGYLKTLILTSFIEERKKAAIEEKPYKYSC